MSGGDLPSGDPTALYERGERQHDDKGRIDPAVLAGAQVIDEALDALLIQARAVVALNPNGGPNGGRAVEPLTLIRAIEKLEARLNLFDGAFAQLLDDSK